MSEGEGAIIAAAIVGTITIIATWVTISDNNRRKKDELFFKALDFLGGGTQNRNLGIAAIELSLKSEKHQALCMSLLTGSAIYLLKESKQKTSEHESYNLKRIMDLLLNNNSMLIKKDSSMYRNYEALQKAIQSKKSSKINPGDTTKDDFPEDKQVQEIFKKEEELHKAVKAAKEKDNNKGLIVAKDDLDFWEDRLTNLLNGKKSIEF